MMAIKDILEKIVKDLKDRFQDDMLTLILYGSWAKGTAHAGSDIDLLLVSKKMDKDTNKKVDDVIKNIDTDRSITIVTASIKEFRKETVPLYTAVKKEGEIIYGKADISINPEPPDIKYAEFFKKSLRFESEKIKTAEYLIEKDLASGIADLCYVASKHTIQAALALKGKGYSSKVSVLLPLTKKYLGETIAEKFLELFKIYVKSEYGLESISEEEAKLAVSYSKEILAHYSSYSNNSG